MTVNTRIPGRPDIELAAYYPQFAWYYPECELQTKAWFVDNAGLDWVYLDCGANVGYYSILFGQLSPAGWVHAVEPTETAAMLETNLAHNRVTNVSVHRVAVGAADGRRREKVYRIWGEPPEEFEYEFVTVDSFVGRAGLDRIDCLKIDVDSFDFDVLRGAARTLDAFDPWVVVELNHALGLRAQSNMGAVEWLMSRGYREALVLDHDNFVLKRSVQRPRPAGEFTLAFGTRPPLRTR